MRRQYSLRQFHAMPTLISCLMVGYVYFSIAVYIPYLAPWHSRHWVTAMYVLSPLAASLTLASYLQAVLLDPGAVPPDWNTAYRRVPILRQVQRVQAAPDPPLLPLPPLRSAV